VQSVFRSTTLCSFGSRDSGGTSRRIGLWLISPAGSITFRGDSHQDLEWVIKNGFTPWFLEEVRRRRAFFPLAISSVDP
jgi:hypothetical protein